MAKTANADEKLFTEGKEGKLLTDDRFLRRVAQAYWEESLTQEEIAGREYCSRQAVSKALQRAKDKDYVQITVVPDMREGFLRNLTRQLRLQLGLEDLILVNGNARLSRDKKANSAVMANIAKAAADYVDELVTDRDLVAVGGGTEFMRGLVRFLRPTRTLRELRVIPTIGFVSTQTGPGDANLIAYDFAQAYSSEHHNWFPAPAHVHTQAEVQQIRKLPIIRDTYALMAEPTVVLTGLWPKVGSDALVEKGVLEPDDMEEIEARRPAVDINHYFFDVSGNCINDMLKPPPFFSTGMEISRFKELIEDYGTKIILVAGGGPHYISAIRSALSAGLANILITDHFTAQALLVER